MGPHFADPKLEHACHRLQGASPEATIQAVADINGIIVDHLVREHPDVTEGGVHDFDLLRRLWKQHERIDPID